MERLAIIANRAATNGPLQRLKVAGGRRAPTSPNSKCARCQDSGFIHIEGQGSQLCPCRRERIRAAKIAALPERFRLASLDDFKPLHPQQRQARKIIAGNVNGSFFLWGHYARGKTYLATAQYKKLIEAGRPSLFMTMTELLRELRRAELSLGPNSADPDFFCEVLERVRRAEGFHLFLDDVDKFAASDFKFQALFDVVDTIYKRQLGLTITSNLSLSELARDEILHPAIVARIDAICTAIEV